MSATNPKNYCTSCGQDFSSVQLFDRHRVGTHEYTYQEGLRMEPLREDGRRCLTVDELRDGFTAPSPRGREYKVSGMVLDDDGVWTDPDNNARVAKYFENR